MSWNGREKVAIAIQERNMEVICGTMQRTYVDNSEMVKLEKRQNGYALQDINKLLGIRVEAASGRYSLLLIGLIHQSQQKHS